MHDEDLEHCKDCIRRELEQFQEAPCPEVAERHRQLAHLYKAQLTLLAQKHLPE